jgi:hypothetical protein
LLEERELHLFYKYFSDTLKTNSTSGGKRRVVVEVGRMGAI